MYCKCSGGNNYQVIGACASSDLSEYKEMTPWVQITVPEILHLPECYPEIGEIERVYVNVVIDDTTMIATPESGENTSVEGLNSTNRMLIVEGSVCQTLIYTADECVKSLHSINFKYPFYANIVLPSSKVPIEDDTTIYCVEPCIENVYVKALNSKTVFKSVSLFLLAVEATPVCPVDSQICGTINNTTGDAGVGVNVVLKDSSNNVVAVKHYLLGVGVSQDYCFGPLCAGEYSIVITVDNTVKYKVEQNVVNPVTVPPAKIVNANIVRNT